MRATPDVFRPVNQCAIRGTNPDLEILETINIIFTTRVPCIGQKHVLIPYQRTALSQVPLQLGFESKLDILSSVVFPIFEFRKYGGSIRMG